RRSLGRQMDQDVDDLRAVQPHDGQDRSELDHHREDAARIVEAEQLRADQEVRRARYREELGHPLNDAEDRCLKCRRHEGSTKYEVGSRKSEVLPTSYFRLPTYEALAFRCGFDRRCACCAAGAGVAGACAAARVGPPPRQNETIAAAMKTLE